MSDYDGGEQLDPGYTGNDQPETLDPGYTGNDQPDVFGGHGTDFGHYEAGQEHEAQDHLHQDHGAQADFGSQFGIFEQDHHEAESTALVHGQHVEYSSGYDEGEQPAFTGGDIDELQNRLGSLGEDHGGEAHLGVASN
ncbi:hypothetical protein [Dactylosporangium sp. CA-233914]|uniref:hypothetical protein n=1 Tax=Dactylosporangium sp. CA-233914 TaxID=3239934 RepID=UPI003D8B1C27